MSHVPHDKTGSFPDDDDLNSYRRIYHELNDELSRMSKDNTAAMEFKVALRDIYFERIFTIMSCRDIRLNNI